MTNPTGAFQRLGLAADCALAIAHYEHVDAHGFDGPGSRPTPRVLPYAVDRGTVEFPPSTSGGCHESDRGRPRVSVPGRHVGDPVRQGEVTAVRGSEAEPLYVVHWDDGHEGTCSPGAEARVAAPLRAVTGTLPGPDPLPDPLPPDPITPIGPPFPAPAPRPTDPEPAPPL